MRFLPQERMAAPDRACVPMQFPLRFLADNRLQQEIDMSRPQKSYSDGADAMPLVFL
jgi:hypothetical protein